jgi:hypothetical protein
MRKVSIFVAFALLVGTLVFGSSQAAQVDGVHCLIFTGICAGRAPKNDPNASVPCGVYGSAYTKRCPNPFEEGIVDGQWVGIVAINSGGNGGATSLLVFSTGIGGNGAITKALGKITGLSVSDGMPPDGLEAIFHRGKLWVYNYVHLPGQGHFDLTNEAVQQYGFDAGAFNRERSAIVPINASDATISSALERR